jgi:hypothetical protein
VKLIHIYQFSLAQHAYDEPLPVTDVSNPVQLLRKALCPVWELETIDPDRHPLSKMRSYVEHMLLHRLIRSKKST